MDNLSAETIIALVKENPTVAALALFTFGFVALAKMKFN